MASDTLLSDGTHRNTLAILRDLGFEFSMDVTSHLPKYRTLCSLSKYTRSTLKVGNPSRIEEYGERILQLLSRGDHDYFIPVGLESYLASSRLKHAILDQAKALIPDPDSMEIASKKEKTMELASKIGVPTPATTHIQSPDDLSKIEGFPVVLKSSETGNVRYCRRREDLRDEYERVARKSRSDVIAQEYITGFGCGFYGVYNKGKLIDFFLHRRIKEFPSTGGPSAEAESFRSEKLFLAGKKLADALEWTGPIMVEFKHDSRTDEFKLMEVNPKLWGSLDLTISAGIDIPRIILGVADGTITKPVADRYEMAHYREVRYRWIVPDEMKVLCSNPNLRDALRLFRSEGSCTNLNLSDPIPTLFSASTGIVDCARILVDERKRFPHGRRPVV